MDAYIDLSIIVFLFNYIISFIYSMIIFDKIKYNIGFIIQTSLISFIAMIVNLLAIPYFHIFFMFIYSLIIGIVSIKLMKTILLTLFIYYINTAYLLLIGGCYLYDGILLISTPFVTTFILLIPIYICLIHIIFTIIYKKIKYNRFKVKCKIIFDNKIYKGYGYYDTGNCLIYNDVPVIFIKQKPFNNNGEVIAIKGINNTELTYLAYKGKLEIKNKEMNVYVVFIGDKHDFNNCSFLLNKYVL